MTDIRGIRYEISKPVKNLDDGFYYQRVRQVDGQGNLLGIGDQLIKLPNPDSTDGRYVPSIDLSKLGTMGGTRLLTMTTSSREGASTRAGRDMAGRRRQRREWISAVSTDG